MKLINKTIAAMLFLCILISNTPAVSETEDQTNIRGLTLADAFNSEVSGFMTSIVSDYSEKKDILFYSGGKWNRFFRLDDRMILYTEQTSSSASAYLTGIQVLIKKSCYGQEIVEQMQGIIESCLRHIAVDGDHLFELFSNTSACWQYVDFYGPDYYILTLKYVGEIPGYDRFDYRILEITYPDFLPEEINENALTLSAFMQLFLPGVSVNEFKKCRYTLPNSMIDPDYGMKMMGRQIERYIVHEETFDIDVSLWREQDVNDPKIIEFDIQYLQKKDSKELLPIYIHDFALLSGMEDELFLPLRYLLGDETTWTSIMNQKPYAVYQSWKLVFSTRNGFPVATMYYVGDMYEKNK